MSTSNKFHPLKNLKFDIPASIVVFLVAVPLCLGIALASGAPLFAGLIAGMVGGLVVGSLSGSGLGVSGPAAGLAVIVLNAIGDLGGYEIFLLAVVLAGIIQLIIGFARGGIIAYYFPSSVIIGMLAGIGIVIFLKQLPHAFGYDGDPIGDFEFNQIDQQNTFSELINMLNYVSYGALIITAVSLAILLIWETKFFKQHKILKLIPGPLLAVATGVLLSIAFNASELLSLRTNQFVQIPVAESLDGFLANFTFPDWSAITNPDVYFIAVLIAVVASLETLLSVEAIDKLDPYKRVTPTNRELKAQGVGNMISGLIGGLPVTQVIVRSSTNMQSGGRTKASAVIHGGLILVSIIAIPHVLNFIPLATLASILLLVGYKLAKPALFKKMRTQGKGQFIPFVVTVLGVVFTDLLIGIAIGLVVSVVFILYNNYKIPFKVQRNDAEGDRNIRIELAQEVTFLNKASLLKTLDQIPDNAKVEIDTSKTFYMHHDIIEIIEDFKIGAAERGIHLTIIDLYKERHEDRPSHISVSYNGNNEKISTEVISPETVKSN